MKFANQNEMIGARVCDSRQLCKIKRVENADTAERFALLRVADPRSGFKAFVAVMLTVFFLTPIHAAETVEQWGVY
jgi:hypothetical protein